jgi:DNA segregation ATPase FtsK/SpoIIIE, S-DNA-T family
MHMTASDVQALTEFGRRGKALIMTCDLPGKIVVNDHSGDDNSNLAGKVAFLTAERREQLLQELCKRAEALPEDKLPRRVIFNGQQQPALLDNPYIGSMLRRPSWPTEDDLASVARKPLEAGGLGFDDWFTAEEPRVVWLGQQFSVRGQATVVFRRRTAENAVLIGGNNAARYGMLASMLVGFSLNARPSEMRFVVLDRSTATAPWSSTLEGVYNSVLKPSGFEVAFSREAADAERFINDLMSDMERRGNLKERDLASEPSVFAFMTELDGVPALRKKSDGYGGMADSPLGATLSRLIAEGPPLGMHIVLSFAGVRPMAHVVDERRGLINFRHRVALQMSEDDSHTFVRSRRASQLQLEGPTPVCALYLDVENDQAVRFKPYTADPTRPEAISGQLQEVGATLQAWSKVAR